MPDASSKYDQEYLIRFGAEVRAEIDPDGDVSILFRVKPEDRLIALRTIRFYPQRDRRRQASSACIGGEQPRRHLLDHDAAESEDFSSTIYRDCSRAGRGIRTDLIVDLIRRDEEEWREPDRAPRVRDRNRRFVQRGRQRRLPREH